MANPNEAEMDDQLKGGVLLLDNYLIQQTIPADEDAYNQIVNSDFAASQSNGARLFRSRGAGAAGSGASVLGPILTAYTHHIVNAPERSAQAAIDRIYAYFQANGKTVKSRGITYGVIPSFGVNKGVTVRLTVDENGYDLENEFVETKTLRCIRDENTGAERFREVFEIRGENAGVDQFDATSSGAIRRDYQAKDSSSSLLSNSSFSQFAIAGIFTAGRYDLVALDTVTGWTLNDPVGFGLDQNAANVARDIVGDTTPTSLVAITGGARIATQAFSVNRLSLSADVPYLPEVWVKPAAGVTVGNITIRWGVSSVVVALNTLNAGAWNDVFAAMDSALWAATFNEEDASFEIEVSGHDGDVFLDEVRFGTMEPFDGTWWNTSTAAAAKFLLDDQQIIADTFTAADSKIQKWFWRVYGRYLPHSGTPTVTDPV